MLVKFCFSFLKILPELDEHAFIFFILGWLTFSVTGVAKKSKYLHIRMIPEIGKNASISQLSV
jgi:hypothetical protein